MKKQQVSPIHQRLRLKHHLLNSKARAKRLRTQRKCKSNRVKASQKTIDYNSSAILNMLKLPTGLGFKKVQKHMVIKTPKCFCILRHPEIVLNWLARFQKLALTKDVKYIMIEHHRTKHFSLGSEMLLGLIANEVKKIRSLAGNPIHYNGALGKNPAHNDLINDVGVVAEIPNAKMDTSCLSDQRKIHVFKGNSNLNEQASQTAEDLTNTVTKNLVEHINEGLADHQLQLNELAADNLRKCVGEVLDNVDEHCGQATPYWFVRGYLNNNHREKTLELMIMNAGRSIADSFLELEDEHYSKNIAMEYVNKHKNKIDEDALLTIAALQGNISSKNNKSSDTRGQGTVTLIEAFEDISRDYESLRCPTSTNKSLMGLITGNTVINFNEKYKSKTTEDDETGDEKVIIPFNNQQSLNFPPDINVLKKMQNAYFSGVIININIPLSGSLTPIKGKNDE